MRGGGPGQVLNLNAGQNSDTICANADECMCILRIRYNISTADYNSVGAYTGAAQFTDSSVNCPSVNQGNQANVDDAATGQNQDESCYSTLANGGRPLYNRPYVQAFDGDNAKLSIALNTDQSGRTWCSSAKRENFNHIPQILLVSLTRTQVMLSWKRRKVRVKRGN